MDAAHAPADARPGIAIAMGAAKTALDDPRCAGRSTYTLARPEDVSATLAALRPHRSVLLLAPAETLTYAFLNDVMATATEMRTPVGVLPCGSDGPTPPARRQPPAPHVGAMYCNFRDSYGCGVEFGRREAGTFLNRLGEGVEAMVLHGHGNGADLQVGDHVLCVQIDQLRGTPGPTDRTLPCQVGGACRLGHVTMQGYWGAAAVKARIVVLLSCWGYLPADGLLSPGLGFASALLRGDHVEAFVGSTRVSYGTPDVARATLAYLESGGTAGELALLLNTHPGSATPSYVCIGDPDVVVQRPAGEPHRRHQCGDTGEPAARSRAEALAEAAMLETITRQLAPPGAVLAGLRRASAAGVRGPGPAALASETAEWVVRSLAARPDLDTPRASGVEEEVDSEPAGPCPFCGDDTVRRTLRDPGLPDAVRHVQRCDRHGVLHDEPRSGPRVAVRRAVDGTTRLVSTRPGARVLAAAATGAGGSVLVEVPGVVRGDVPGNVLGDASPDLFVVAVDLTDHTIEFHRSTVDAR